MLCRNRIKNKGVDPVNMQLIVQLESGDIMRLDYQNCEDFVCSENGMEYYTGDPPKTVSTVLTESDYNAYAEYHNLRAGYSVASHAKMADEQKHMFERERKLSTNDSDQKTKLTSHLKDLQDNITQYPEIVEKSGWKLMTSVFHSLVVCGWWAGFGYLLYKSYTGL